MSKECALYHANVAQLHMFIYSLLHAVPVVLRIHIGCATAPCHGCSVNCAHAMQAFVFVVTALGMFCLNARSMKRRQVAEFVPGVGNASALLPAVWTGFVRIGGVDRTTQKVISNMSDVLCVGNRGIYAAKTPLWCASNAPSMICIVQYLASGAAGRQAWKCGENQRMTAGALSSYMLFVWT